MEGALSTGTSINYYQIGCYYIQEGSNL